MTPSKPAGATEHAATGITAGMTTGQRDPFDVAIDEGVELAIRTIGTREKAGRRDLDPTTRGELAKQARAERAQVLQEQRERHQPKPAEKPGTWTQKLERQLRGLPAGERAVVELSDWFGRLAPEVQNTVSDLLARIATEKGETPTQEDGYVDVDRYVNLDTDDDEPLLPEPTWAEDSDAELQTW